LIVNIFKDEGYDQPGELIETRTLYAGSALGEVAILAECKRTATVTVKSKKVKLWTLDKRTFENIICYFVMEKRDFHLESLEEIPIF